jgi:hypothetical protein
MFILLPHHAYRIYQAGLACLDDTTVARLAWLGQFRRECSPCSQRGLHRQVATSPAFLRFLAGQLELLGKVAASHPDVRIHKQATLAMTALLGGLQMLGQVGEERLHLLLQIVLAGFKSPSPELAGLASILLGCLLPRVALKPKAVAKVCKAVGKLARRGPTEDSLWLVLLLARTQPGEPARLLELLLQHEAVINEVVQQARHSAEEDTADRVDGLVYSLAVVAGAALELRPGELRVAAGQEELALLGLLAATTGLLPLSAETAGLLADTVRSLNTGLSKDEVQLKGFRKALAEIQSNLERLNPDTVQGAVAGQGDILFVPGHEAPSAAEVEIARIVASDPLVNFFSDRLLLKCSDQKTVRKIMKKNEARVEKVLGADTAFLLSQLDRPRLETLLRNLLRASEGLPEVQRRAAGHLCSAALASPGRGPELELLLLPLLLTGGPETAQLVLGSHFASESPLLSLLSSLTPSSGMFARALTQKLSLVLRPSHLATVTASPALRGCPTLATLLLRLAPLVAPAHRPEPAWRPALARLLAACTGALTLTGVSDREDNVGLVAQAAEEGSLSWTTISGCLACLQTEETEVATEVLGLLPALHQHGKAAEAEEVTAVLVAGLQDAYLAFLLERGLATPDPRLAFLCLHLADLHAAGLPVGQLRKQGCDRLALFTLHFLLSPQLRYIAAFRI